MKALIVIKRSPTQRFLVELHTDNLVKEISRLVARRKNSLAIVTALAKGKLGREVYEHEVHKIKADVVLTEENTRWDLMEK